MAGRKVKRRNIPTPDLKWADALQRHILNRHEEPIPEGWQTATEISKEIGHNKEYTSRWLSRMIAEGKAERKLFSQVVNSDPPYRKRLPMFRLLALMMPLLLCSCNGREGEEMPPTKYPETPTMGAWEQPEL